MYAKVKEYIQKRILISDEDLEKSFQYSSVRYYKKGIIYFAQENIAGSSAF